MSRYYIYQMTAITEEGTKGSYIGQHKIGRKCPLDDGYKGSGSDWKKYILQRNIPVEKEILRMCENIEEANYWEKYYIEQAKVNGIYLWNKCKGGGSYDHNKIYTKEELEEHKKEYNKQWCEANKEHSKEYRKQYYEANREHKKEYNKQYKKQWYEANREKIVEHSKQYYEANKEHKKEYNKQWYEANREYSKEYRKQYDNQQCLYNGETLTLAALRKRFRKAGITNSTAEAKLYLIG